MENTEKKPLLQRLRPNFIWIILVVMIWYIFIAGITHLFWDLLVRVLKTNGMSNEMVFTIELYAATIVDIFTLWVLTTIFAQNHYIWKSFGLPRRKDALLTSDDIRAEFYGRSRNGFGMLGKGLLLGFLTNFICIICALLHGDIKLYFETSITMIPYFLFSLFCVCIQSSAEELWCRGFMYERLHERYPLWVSIAINGILFGLLHMFNPGVSALPIIGIIVTGVSYSLLRWYSGSIWIAMGIHTGWNFTQNFLFGLPNSGLVSEASLFHLDASVANSSWVYDYGFGVEGGVPAIIVDAAIGIICLYLAYKSGRIGELNMNYAKTQEARGVSIEPIAE